MSNESGRYLPKVHKTGLCGGWRIRQCDGDDFPRDFDWVVERNGASLRLQYAHPIARDWYDNGCQTPSWLDMGFPKETAQAIADLLNGLGKDSWDD